MGQYDNVSQTSPLCEAHFGDLPYLLRFAATACMSRGKVQLAIPIDTLLVAEAWLVHIVCVNEYSQLPSSSVTFKLTHFTSFSMFRFGNALTETGPYLH